MKTSLFEIFKIGIGPSSSHTVGPMRAAAAFATGLLEAGLLDKVGRVEANLYKLAPVLSVEDVTHVPVIARSLAFIKVSANDESRYRLMEIARVFRARVVDLATESLVIEITGTEDKVDALVGVLRPFGILEMARTGQVVMSRGTKSAPDSRSGGRSDFLLEEEASQAV